MTKQRYGSVIVVNDNNQVIENRPFTIGEEAEEHFLSFCRTYISNFDEYTKEDIDIILENGFEKTGHNSISIMWF